MKKIFGVILIFIGIFIGIASLTNGFKPPFQGKAFTFKNSESQISSEQFLKVDDINLIQVEGTSTNISIIPSTNDELQLKLRGSEGVSMFTEQNGGTLSIRTKNERRWFSIRSSSTIEVLLPDSYQNQLRLITSSGNITVNELIKLNSLSTHSSSGSVNVFGGEVVSFDHQSSSGSLYVNGLKSADSHINASSGSIKLDSYSGKLNGRTSSGRLQVHFTELNGDVRLQASSGSINVQLPKEEHFDIDVRTSSGRFRLERPLTVTERMDNKNMVGSVGNGGYNVQVSTSSGSITIE